MRIAYTREGQPLPIFEPGDFARIKRDDLSLPIAFRGGEWGIVASVDASTADLLLGGHSRPANAVLPYARGVPTAWLAPCDAHGAAILLEQRDVRRNATRAQRLDGRSRDLKDMADLIEVGDLVRMRRDEGGEFVSARAGEWGEVTRTGGGQLDLLLAGFSRPRTADMPVARGISIHLVEPCDRQGRSTKSPTGLRETQRWR